MEVCIEPPSFVVDQGKLRQHSGRGFTVNDENAGGSWNGK